MGCLHVTRHAVCAPRFTSPLPSPLTPFFPPFSPPQGLRALTRLEHLELRPLYLRFAGEVACPLALPPAPCLPPPLLQLTLKKVDIPAPPPPPPGCGPDSPEARAALPDLPHLTHL